MKVRDSVVLITGANRGIGRAFAEEFLKSGAKKIYLGVRQPETVASFVSHDPKRLIPLHLDVTDSKDIYMAASKARDVNILINNAGVLYDGNLLDDERMAEARHEMDVNYFGPLAMIRAFAPVLKMNGGGAVINISSIAGLVAMPGIPTYSTSKAALHFLTLEARMELSSQNTSVIGVYPGPVDTDMARSFKLLQIKPDQVARETIRGLESGETHIFPDPLLKDIYAVLQNGSKYVAEKIGAVPELAVRAA